MKLDAELLDKHDGLPFWFSYLVSYILKCLNNRDRFNIYNACKALRNSLPEQIIYAYQIREVLSSFNNYGFSVRGKHQQLILPHGGLIGFWKTFYIPAQSDQSWDLSFFANILYQKRHQDIVKDRIFRQYLPANYKSLKKND